MPSVVPGLAGVPHADVTTTVASGNVLLAIVIAVAAGLVSFASPCVLPLVPGFLGYVTGLGGSTGSDRTTTRPVPAGRAQGVLTGGDGEPTRSGVVTGEPAARAVAREVTGRSRVVLGAALFVLGFSVVFLSAMALAATVGVALIQYRRELQIAGGVLVIAMALVFLGIGTQTRLTPRWRPRAGLLGAPLLGAVFAIGWTPCSGPTLGVISVLAATNSPSLGRGVALGAAYCLGLGVPFLLIAAGWSRAERATAWLRRRQRVVHLVGGGLLLVVGVLLVTGWWDALVTQLQNTLVGSFEVML